MQYRLLAKTGVKVSALGWGNYVSEGDVDGEGTYEIMKQVFEWGVNLFDTAEMYSDGKAESQMGYAIAKGLREGVWKRSDLVISTKLFKCGNGINDVGLSRKHIIEGMKASLTRLQVDTVDIVYCHRPDSLTAMEETVRAMTYLINSGMAYYWGTSEWSSEQISEAYFAARQYHLIPPVVEQPQYNLFSREKVEKEFQNLYTRDIGLGIVGYSPLLNGLLTEKYLDQVSAPPGTRLAREEFREANNYYFQTPHGQDTLNKIKALAYLAGEVQVTLPQLALGWALTNPNVTSILLGGVKNQLKENIVGLQVATHLRDHPEVLAKIDEILLNKPLIRLSPLGR